MQCSLTASAVTQAQFLFRQKMPTFQGPPGHCALRRTCEIGSQSASVLIMTWKCRIKRKLANFDPENLTERRTKKEASKNSPSTLCCRHQREEGREKKTVCAKQNGQVQLPRLPQNGQCHIWDGSGAAGGAA